MTCPRCGSAAVFTQQQSDIRLKNKHHNILWWLFIGWWWLFVKWIVFTVPALIVKIFGHRKQKLVQKTYIVSVCQNCGYHWRP